MYVVHTGEIMEMLFKKDGEVEERRMEVGLRAEKVEGKEGGGMEERGMEGWRGGWRGGGEETRGEGVGGRSSVLVD